MSDIDDKRKKKIFFLKSGIISPGLLKIAQKVLSENCENILDWTN